MIEQKTLYIVATPIGNLSDITFRAVDTLKAVHLIVAEDTRHSRQLLQRYGISTPVESLHQHNEQSRAGELISRLQEGASIALISDAGTPTISDPGYCLVQAVTAAGLPVRPIPGPSAVISALSIAGMPADQFVFSGFLPTKAAQRQQKLIDLAQIPQTIVLYEAPHRILALLEAIPTAFGESRTLLVAREMCKYFESYYRGTSQSIYEYLTQHSDEVRGEFVVCISGNPDPTLPMVGEMKRILSLLLTEMPMNKAVKLTAQIVGLPRNQIYDYALTLKMVY